MRRLLLCLVLFATIAVPAWGLEDDWEEYVITAWCEDTAMSEASGIGISRSGENIFYAGGDNQGDERVYVFNLANGDRVANWDYNLNASPNQPEDMVVGPGPDSQKTYFYLGLIGENNAVWPSTMTTLQVLRSEEPTLDEDTDSGTITAPAYDRLYLAYPSSGTGSMTGQRSDSETLMVDEDANLYIVSKRTNPSRLFKAAYPQSTNSGSPTVMTYLGNLPFTWATGGSISEDGKYMVIVRDQGGGSSTTVVYAYVWERLPDQTWGDAIADNSYATVPICSGDSPVDYSCGQHEAAAFSLDNDGSFYVIREGNDPPFNFIEHKSSCSINADCDDGLFCNGAESCSANECVFASDPCTGSEPRCNETSNECIECINAADCDDSNPNTTDACASEVCTRTGAYDIEGDVMYYSDNGTEPSTDAVAGVLMTATGTTTTTNYDTTDSLGVFAVDGRAGDDVTVTPTMTFVHDDYGFTITAYDASLIAQHAVSLITLSTNQQAVADVTDNGTISSFDAAYIAGYAVQIYNYTPTWVFMPEDETFSDIAADEEGVELLAGVMGDVSGTLVEAKSFASLGTIFTIFSYSTTSTGLCEWERKFRIWANDPEAIVALWVHLDNYDDDYIQIDEINDYSLTSGWAAIDNAGTDEHWGAIYDTSALDDTDGYVLQIVLTEDSCSIPAGFPFDIELMANEEMISVTEF